MSAPRYSTTGVRLDRVVVDDETEWEDDYTCRALVVHHPDGMTLDEIGQVMRSRPKPILRLGPQAERRRQRQRESYARQLDPSYQPGEPLSRARVRQIEASALRKLARNPETRDWLHALIEARRGRDGWAPEDHAMPGDWPTYEDSRRLRHRGNKGAWGWDGEARPPRKAGGS